MSEKMSRKELKEPDAFVKAGSVARNWFQDNARTVSIGVVLALLVLGGVAFADYLGDRGNTKAAQALGERLKMLERPVSETATTTGDDAPFKSHQERQEAIAKAMAEIRAEYKGTPSAQTATLLAGSADLKLRKYDEALKDYTDFLKDARPDDPLRMVAIEGQGYAHEGKGQLDQALALYDQLAKEAKGEMLAGMGLYHRGRVLLLENKKEDAAKVFNDVTTAHAGTGAATLATARLNELKAQGIKLPEPAPQASGADGGDTGAGGTDAG